MANVYATAALEMFRAARIDRPNATEVKALAEDLQGLVNDELDGNDPTNCIPADELVLDAVGILRERIGGFTALQGYVNCLTAKQR